MKPVRLLCYIFLVFVDLKVHKIQWYSYYFYLTVQQNVALIYSVTICEQLRKRIAHRHWELPT